MAEKNRSFSKRLLEKMAQSGIKNKNQLAKVVGVNATAAGKYINEGRIPEAPILLRIADALKTTVEWLLTGRERGGTAQEPRIVYFEAEDPEIRREFEKRERRDSFIPIRILADPADMGPGREVRSGATDGYAVIYDVALPRVAKTQKRKDEKIICLWALGDSMEPTIQKKALVAVDLRVTSPEAIEDRKIYAVWLPEGGLTLKRVVKTEEGLILLADNPDARDFPRVLLGEDASRGIRGKVVWWWSRQD